MLHLSALIGGLVVALLASTAHSQRSVPNSFPHDYPGKPKGDFSPEWQDCRFTYTLTYARHAHNCAIICQIISSRTGRSPM